MPRGDGTGPEGLGSMTGRGAGYSRPGCFNSAVGGRGLARGFRGGRGRGRGRGFRARRFARFDVQSGVQANPVDSEAVRKREINDLQREKEILKEELEAVEKYLEELKEDEE